MKKLAGLLVIIVCFVLIFLLNGEKIFLNIGHGIQKFCILILCQKVSLVIILVKLSFLLIKKKTSFYENILIF